MGKIFWTFRHATNRVKDICNRLASPCWRTSQCPFHPIQSCSGCRLNGGSVSFRRDSQCCKASSNAGSWARGGSSCSLSMILVSSNQLLASWAYSHCVQASSRLAAPRHAHMVIESKDCLSPTSTRLESAKYLSTSD